MSQSSAARSFRSAFAADAFSRVNEEDDSRFYQRDRFVAHLDRQARATVERIIGRLLVESSPKILDLMASWDSHLPDTILPARVVGLGLNPRELAVNQRLDQRIIHDLNQNPSLPLPSSDFDVVICTVSVDYLTRPWAVFADVARVLKPGGLFLVFFSNRMFKTKAVKIWRQSSEAEREILVREFFASVTDFGPAESFVWQGRPRPADDEYAGLGLPSDPVWAVWAEKIGAPESRRRRPLVEPGDDGAPSPEVVARRKARVAETLRCPYCESPLDKWAVPQTPFTEWPNEFMYICFNDACPYLIAGWDAMSTQGNSGFSHRLMYDSEQECCRAVPVPSLKGLREHVVKPRG